VPTTVANTGTGFTVGSVEDCACGAISAAGEGEVLRELGRLAAPRVVVFFSLLEFDMTDGFNTEFGSASNGVNGQTFNLLKWE
jgi:hypothetical protein